MAHKDTHFRAYHYGNQKDLDSDLENSALGTYALAVEYANESAMTAISKLLSWTPFRNGDVIYVEEARGRYVTTYRL